MTKPPLHITPFDPHSASDELWAAFNDTRRALAAEFWRDEPILSDAEIRQEIQRIDPLWEFRRWVAMEGSEVAGSCRVAFRRPDTPNAAVGSRCQGIPVRQTNKIPASTALSSRANRPG